MRFIDRTLFIEVAADAACSSSGPGGKEVGHWSVGIRYTPWAPANSKTRPQRNSTDEVSEHTDWHTVPHKVQLGANRQRQWSVVSARLVSRVSWWSTEETLQIREQRRGSRITDAYNIPVVYPGANSHIILSCRVGSTLSLNEWQSDDQSQENTATCNRRCHICQEGERESLKCVCLPSMFDSAQNVTGQLLSVRPA